MPKAKSKTRSRTRSTNTQTPSEPARSSGTQTAAAADGATTGTETPGLSPRTPPATSSPEHRFFPSASGAQAGPSHSSLPPADPNTVMAVLSRMEQRQAAVDQRLEALQTEVRAARHGQPTTSKRIWAREGNKKNYEFNLALRDQLTTAKLVTSPASKDDLIDKAVARFPSPQRKKSSGGIRRWRRTGGASPHRPLAPHRTVPLLLPPSLPLPLLLLLLTLHSLFVPSSVHEAVTSVATPATMLTLAPSSPTNSPSFISPDSVFFHHSDHFPPTDELTDHIVISAPFSTVPADFANHNNFASSTPPAINHGDNTLNFLFEQDADNPAINPFDDNTHVLFEQDADNPQVRGRLRAHLDKWRSIGASPFVLRILQHGFCLPFLQLPPNRTFPNQQSCFTHSAFVDSAVQELLSVGSIVEVPNRDHLRLCSPLKVVPKKGGKLRLIINLHFLNTHLAKFKFKYDGLPCLINLFRKGDWFINFDLRNGYHHIDMADCHMPYLGFSWAKRHFMFASLPFGLSQAPYVFTKLMRPVVAHWRGQGFRCFMYLDDGSGANGSFQGCADMAAVMRQDLADLGLLAHQAPPKSYWIPRQEGELLGYIINLRDGSFQVPPRRCDIFSSLIIDAIASSHSISARSVSRITGNLVSMSLALGPVVRLWTRSLYAFISSSDSWDSRRSLPQAARDELLFWQDNFSKLLGYPIWTPSPSVDVITYSDASNHAWGGFTVTLGSTHTARGNFERHQAAPLTSSTYRELLGTRLVLQSLIHLLPNKQVLHRSDNQNVVRILSGGSRVTHLHRLTDRDYTPFTPRVPTRVTDTLISCPPYGHVRPTPCLVFPVRTRATDTLSRVPRADT
ncbi:uncharacterized protein LOC144867937 [Branchiostoma floridae x Branchiostoma japonicum]